MNGWQTDEDKIFNPSNGKTVLSFQRLGIVGETFGFDTVFSETIDINSNRWADTGWPLPARGLYTFDIVASFQGHTTTNRYPTIFVSGEELRALPRIPPGFVTSENGEIEFFIGTDRVGNDVRFNLARHLTRNTLVIKTQRDDLDPTPLIIKKVSFTGKGIGQKGPDGDKGPQGDPGSSSRSGLHSVAY